MAQHIYRGLEVYQPRQQHQQHRYLGTAARAAAGAGADTAAAAEAGADTAAAAEAGAGAGADTAAAAEAERRM
jgi:hypothetical protein